jgi:hypothetical protein
MLANQILIFDYRLCHARKSVKCMFGIFTAKFKIFEGPICSKEETVISCIKVSVACHSFIRRLEESFVK